MDRLDISYSAFKACSAGLEVFWCQEQPNVYVMATALGSDILFSVATSSADVTDFLTWKPVLNECSTGNDCCARALLSINNRSKDGVRVQEYIKPGRNLCVIGKELVADLGKSTVFLVQFSTEIEIQGVVAEFHDFTDHDRIELEMVAPMGPGGSLVSLVKWTETVAVPPSGKLSFDSSDSKTLPLGVSLRVTYVSTATTGPSPEIHLYLKTWR